MKFKKITFRDKNTQRVYDNYFKNMNNVLKPIREEDKQEVLMEFNSHIYESLQKNSTEDELETLLNAIDKLGAPEEVLKPLIADKLLEKATKSFNPIDVFKALALNITNGISYIIFAILYLFLGSFIFLIFAKISRGDEIGMFFKNGEFMVLGLAPKSGNSQEVLGDWFIPAIIAFIVIFYFVITLLLKLKKLINKK